MIKKILFLVLVVVAFVSGITYYLQPDDLSGCDASPSTNVGCNSVDAIIAISGGDTGARSREAINLYQSGWARVLIFSGAAQDKDGPSNAFEMKQIALRSGVPESAIIIDEAASSTKENAENVQKIFNKLGTKTAILVTSGYHQRRASLTFNKYTEGVEIINHPVSSDNDWSIWWWMTPRGWWLVGSEIIRITAFLVVGAA